MNHRKNILIISSVIALGFVIFGSTSITSHAEQFASQDLQWSFIDRPLVSTIIEGNDAFFSKTVLTDYRWGTSTVETMLTVTCTGCEEYEPVSKTTLVTISQSTAASVRYNVEFPEPGIYELTFIIDPNNKIEETNKDNNVKKHRVFVYSNTIWNISVR